MESITKISVAIVDGGEESIRLLRALGNVPEVRLCGLIESDPSVPILFFAQQNRIPLYKDLRELFQQDPAPMILFDLGSDHDPVRQEVAKLWGASGIFVQVLPVEIAQLVIAVYESASGFTG